MLFKSQIDNSQCIGAAEIVIGAAASAAVQLPTMEGATKAILQFFTDDAGVIVIGVSKIGYTPIAVICESTDAATQGLPGSNAGKGFLLYNLSNYEVYSQKNLQQTTIMSYATGYNVYCRILFYK